MIYTPLTKKAMAIMWDAHRDQLDKSGVPYVFHPWHVAESMPDELTCCAALLHDVLEDAGDRWSPERLLAEGIPAEVVDALLLLTHKEGVPYLDYVRGLKPNPIAAAVKRADLLHNSDLSRLVEITDADRTRAEKYRAALEILASGD